MKTQLENSDLTIFMEGRIDTNNAPAVETELLALSERDPGAKLTLDASALEYISSAVIDYWGRRGFYEDKHHFGLNELFLPERLGLP